MGAQTYIGYPNTAQIITEAGVEVVARHYVNEAAKVWTVETALNADSSTCNKMLSDCQGSWEDRHNDVVFLLRRPGPSSQFRLIGGQKRQ